MELLTVDETLCVGCAACVEICPAKILEMNSENRPQTDAEQCMGCGHCVAVCPQAALSNRLAPLTSQPPLLEERKIDAATAAQFLRSRRSIRNYREQAVPRELLAEVLDIARLAPTGGNTQGVSFRAYSKPQTLQAVVKAVVDWMEENVERMPFYRSYIERYRVTGEDVVLRGAPCLVIALADASFQPRGRDNAHFMLTYAELYAPALGLGSCWAGLLESCAASGCRPLLDALQLPPELFVSGALMIGYPKFSYRRLPDRAPLKLEWEEEN